MRFSAKSESESTWTPVATSPHIDSGPLHETMSVPHFASNMPRGSSPPVPTLSGLDILAVDMTYLVKKIQNLSHLGIEDSNIRLPKICVVGDQSTGKSSVIEAISEIKVPRSDGTCTRCPLEINLSESEADQPWRCVVYLSYRYMFDPSKLVKGTDARKIDRLGPWAQPEGNITENNLFHTVTDRRNLEETIRWAQCATLNPSQDWKDFVPGRNVGTPETIQVKFSPNVVRLDVSGPGYPTLSFFDLPGVINQPEVDEERYLVFLVERLVKKYVREESCIVLLAMTMTNDATNSSAARIIRDIKNAKERTLGVLTKPDRVTSQHEDLAQWIEILDGTKFQLGHGYFVVKNNPDPTVEHAIAREQERDFFTGTFWGGYLAPFQDRFGVPRLQVALSNVLMEKIKKCLPSITYQIDEKALRIDLELKTLPDPPTDNVQHIVLESVIKLGLRIESIFTGGPGSSSMQKFWNEIVTDFQKALAVTRPTMQTYASLDPDDLAEKGTDNETLPGLSPSRLKRKAMALDQRPETKVEGQPRPIPASMYQTGYFESWKSTARSISLDEVRQVKQETNQVGIPNQVNPGAVESLKKDSVQHWEGIAKDFAKALLGIVKRVLFTTLDEVIVNHRQTEMYRELHRIIERFLNQIQGSYLEEISAYSRMEYDRPFTMAEQAHEEAMKKAKSALVRGRNRTRAKHWLAMRNLSEDLIDKVEAELGPDPYAKELEMVAVSDIDCGIMTVYANPTKSSRGYYEVASARFLDVICLIAESKLRTKCRNELIQVINGDLRANCGYSDTRQGVQTTNVSLQAWNAVLS